MYVRDLSGSYRLPAIIVANHNSHLDIFYLIPLGRSLPRDSFILVPFCGKAAVGEPRCFSGDTGLFTAELATPMQQLENQVDAVSS